LTARRLGATSIADHFREDTVNATTKHRDLPPWLGEPSWAIDRSVRLAAYDWMYGRVAAALRRRRRVLLTGSSGRVLVRLIRLDRPLVPTR
jgi:hypothetical protein